MSVRDVIQAAAGASGSVEKTFVEDVFQTYLYTGNGSTQTINNGIDLAGKGGMVWIKNRNEGVEHSLFDTQRGINKLLSSNLTDAQFSLGNVLTPLSTGFYLDSDAQYYPTLLNGSGKKFASWTFRKAPKFFDVVTYTGTGAEMTVNHNLGIAPGMVVFKCTSAVSDWLVYSNVDPTKALKLNTTAAFASEGAFKGTAFTSTSMTFVADSNINQTGQTYVAYLFAHDTTTDGLIQCGSFTTDASGNASVNLGWEPQYVMMKTSSTTGGWLTFDTMRGWDMSTTDKRLLANDSQAEANANVGNPTSTGFTVNATGVAVSQAYIYMAIRRGPMRTPTDGTKVFSPLLWTTPSQGSITNINLGFPADASFRLRRGSSTDPWLISRLTGGGVLNTNSTSAEATNNVYQRWDNQNGYVDNAIIAGGQSMVIEGLRRAPGFFDVVCYTGTGSIGRNIFHNLGKKPELLISKSRSGTGDWYVSGTILGNTGYDAYNLKLNATDAIANNQAIFSSAYWDDGYVYNTGQNASLLNASGSNYVAYLFASCPGVSKVGSYTGNGSSQTINCGFTNGARFVLIKRTDATGDWYVWDTARGIVAATDPHLSLNTTVAEVTTDDTIDPESTGFIVNQVAATNVNVSGGSYIYLAIA